MSRYNDAYSGRCNCVVLIDRYKDLDTGNLYTEKEAEELDVEEKFQIEEIELDVEGYAYYEPGVYGRLPEDCYPTDSYVEIISIEDEHGDNWKPKLTKEEISKIEDTIIEYVKDPY